jgi:hypothetical protein
VYRSFFWDLFIITSKIVELSWFLLLYFYRLYSFNANSLQVAFERKINTALKEINENEISYLEKKTIPFENGLEFNDFHPYAYDLDIFGEHSLFKT